MVDGKIEGSTDTNCPSILTRHVPISTLLRINGFRVARAEVEPVRICTVPAPRNVVAYVQSPARRELVQLGPGIELWYAYGNTGFGCKYKCKNNKLELCIYLYSRLSRSFTELIIWLVYRFYYSLI